MARKTGNISILQFDEHLIAWLRVKPSPKGIEVLSWETKLGVWSAQDGSLELAVEEFVKTRSIAADRVHTVMPRHDMTARILLLPSHDEQELDGMVRLGVEDYVPYPEHELVMDQCLLQRLPDGQSRVLAVFAHRDVVESHVAILRTAGVEPEQISVSTACIATSAILAHGKEGEKFALANLASGGVEVLVFNGNRLEYGRAVATLQDWSAATAVGSEAVEELASEVRATVSAHRRDSEDGIGAERVYLSSEWVDTAQIASALSDTLGYECQPAQFARSLCTQGADRVATLPLASLGAALAAQNRAPVSISLVPASLEQARRRGETRRKFAKVGGFVLAILIALLALYGQAAFQRSRYIAELQNRITEIEPTALSVEAKRRQLIRLQQHLDRRGSALELLAKISELTPASGLNITRYSFSHGEEITLAGRSETLTLVYALADALREAGREDIPQFARAGLGPYREDQEQGQAVIQYEINIPFATSETEGEPEADSE